MEKLTFNPADETDIPVITDVLTNATQYKLTQGDKSWGEEGWFHHEIQDRMSDGSTFYLVKLEDEVVGTVSLSWRDERNWGRLPDNAGYMHQLAGREYLRLDCDTNNQGLCRYYEQHGFIRTDLNSRPDNEMGTYQAVLYERKV